MTILILLSCAAHSQNSKSDTCVPDYQLRIALKKIEQGKLDAAELRMTRQQLDLANKSLDLKDSVIAGQRDLVNAYKASGENYRSQLVIHKGRLDIANFNMDALNKQLRRQKTKTFFVGAAGFLGSIGITYLFLR